jgi:hypothetical protein
MVTTVSEYWRIFAIIMFVIALVETAILGWAWSAGNSMVRNKAFCANDICGNDPSSTSFSFDDYTNVCKCYNNAGDITTVKTIGS